MDAAANSDDKELREKLHKEHFSTDVSPSPYPLLLHPLPPRAIEPAGITAADIELLVLGQDPWPADLSSQGLMALIGASDHIR